MANAITTVSSQFSTPYLTIAEYKQAPTAIDIDDLVGGGDAAINDQELANVIARASSWIDSYCGQVLASTADTEALRATVDRRGFLKIHPRYWPVTEVVSLSYGTLPTLMASVDISGIWIEPEAIVFPIQGLTTSFMGPIQFSGNYSASQEQFVSLTYVNGYANAALSASVAATATALPVNDLTGFTPGMRFEVYDGASTEILTVASTFTVAQGPGNLPLAHAVAYNHAISISVSALPPSVKQAAIYVTSALLKARGNASMVMQTLTPSQIQTSNPAAAGDLASAWEILKPFRRIR